MEPLVSILVITYNSSKTVLETLESAKEQDYKNIELIVSDDCSTDDTATICKKWLDSNNDRFVRALFVEAEKNKGVSANCNQSIRAAQGEWGKVIAGDDILLPNCISSNIKFTKENPEARFIFSQVTTFVDKDGKRIFHENCVDEERISLFNADAKEQYEALYSYSFPPAPAYFFHIETIRQFPYKECYRYCEDYPHYFAVTGGGYKLYFNPVSLVLYRHGDSLFHSTQSFFNEKFVFTYKLFFYNELADYLFYNRKDIYDKHIRKMLLFDFAITVLKNKRNIITVFLYKLVRKFLT